MSCKGFCRSTSSKAIQCTHWLPIAHTSCNPQSMQRIFPHCLQVLQQKQEISSYSRSGFVCKECSDLYGLEMPFINIFNGQQLAPFHAQGRQDAMAYVVRSSNPITVACIDKQELRQSLTMFETGSLKNAWQWRAQCSLPGVKVPGTDSCYVKWFGLKGRHSTHFNTFLPPFLSNFGFNVDAAMVRQTYDQSLTTSRIQDIVAAWSPLSSGARKLQGCFRCFGFLKMRELIGVMLIPWTFNLDLNQPQQIRVMGKCWC